MGVAGRDLAPQWLFSRDLVASSYTETYTAANGSEVTEALQGQVWPGQPPAQGGREGSGGKAGRALTPTLRRTTASTRATWRGSHTPLPASAPVTASGESFRPRHGVRKSGPQCYPRPSRAVN